ncbi:MAG: DUF1987 domain-containing protein [Bacteroidales bacterium]|nr:DUF1987 domain-containing protein [Bacteroidales bacterium]
MRSNMYIARKEDSPEVILDATKKKFSITGVSMPEDSLTFYRPIIQWLEEYVAQPFDSLCLDIKLLYFNTASAKEIARTLATLNACDQSDKITVRWFYDHNDPENLDGCKRYELIPLRYEYYEFDFTSIEQADEPEGSYHIIS